MKWEKLGKVFDPTEHVLIATKFEFAKSPQAIVFDDFVRIYFSGQVKSNNGKYLSYPFYIEMDRSLKRINRISERPVMELGSLGCFDEHGVFPFHVMRDKDQILAFTTGWSRRTSVSIDMSIGLAISNDDGMSFQRVGNGGPVMTANNTEACLVGDGFVRKVDDEYRMWYIFGTQWRNGENGQAERFYRIAGAYSKDRINWHRDSSYLIEPVIEDECQALPTVFQTPSGFHMYFCYRSAFDFRTNAKNVYRLGYAYSKDGLHWLRSDQNSGIDLGATGWDSQMMCYPHVFELDDSFYMLYNGNEFGRFGFGVARLLSE